ncbi:hypothetical protein [Pedobacter jeongneungensis]|uniref:hypothetical protein n=1 Tax=Pedobacter jeongneungensis TaxID=947309 RepID=UPI000469B4E6|nr:hypothetical protein [Pedobacter jeongneungensis]
MKSASATRPIFILLSFIFIPFFSYSSAYWMEITGSGKASEKVTVQLIYGNIDDFGIRHRQTGKELQLAGEFSLSLIDPAGKKTELQISQKADCWETSFTPKDKGAYRILGINNTHPVVDRSAIGGENVLPVDYLCSQYVVGVEQGQLKPMQFLDLTTSKEGKAIKVKAFQNKLPAKTKTKLRVFNPENWEKELMLDDRGTAVFSPTMKGMYIIRLDWIDPKGGSYKGIAYSGIRYRCNYCLFIE